MCNAAWIRLNCVRDKTPHRNVTVNVVFDPLAIVEKDVFMMTSWYRNTFHNTDLFWKSTGGFPVQIAS